MKDEDIALLVRENVKRLMPYSSARDDFKGKASVYLDANENPFQTEFNRYPDPHQTELKTVIGEIKGVNAENIFIGNGSDEAIDLLYRIFCNPGKDRVLIPQPTYGMYQVSARINDVLCDAIPLTKTFDLASSDVLKAILPETKIIFLCSPNNPSGNLLDNREVEHILIEFNGIVVIDEAYIDFTNSASWVSRLGEFPNLVVLQTLSKAWGLANLRLGMAFASVGIVALFNKIKPPYNVAGTTQKTAANWLRTAQKKKNAMVVAIRNEKSKLMESLETARVVSKVFPSDANFLLVRVTNAKNIYEQLTKYGIIVRDRSNVILCDNCLRITVGTAEENHQLIKALRQI